MTEALVQWTLLNNQKYLADFLSFNFSTVLGQEITTDFGRIDFVVKNNSGESLVVELETVLNSKSKLEYCFNQTLNYKNVKFTPNTTYCILYAEETSQKYKQEIIKFGKKENIIIKSYSVSRIIKLYDETIKRLSLNVGLALPTPKNYTICYLRWLNKILIPFKDNKTNKLRSNQIFKPFENSTKSKTNYNCHLQLAFDFEMIKIEDEHYFLTKIGEEYINNFNTDCNKHTKISTIDLTNQQKRILLKVLTNGNWDDKIHKVNIYWFLRFIEVTNGSWLPKKHNFELQKLEIARGLFNVSYKSRTMQEFLTWCSNYCLELGLIEKIKSTSDYDQVILTPLGIEINNIFSLDLTLKKTRLNLNFKYLE
jgi:hypothetical protein